MEKIVLKRQAPPKGKERRATVVVKPEMYLKISQMAIDTNIPIETIVNTLLEEALKCVEIQ